MIEEVLKKLNDDGWKCLEQVNIAYTNAQNIIKAVNTDINEIRGRLDFSNKAYLNLILTLALFIEKPIILTLFGPLEGPQISAYYGSYSMSYTSRHSKSGIIPQFEKKSQSYSYSEFLNFTIKELLMDILV